MRLSLRLVIALAVLIVAYPLLAPRVPEWRGWYARHACPWLDRVRDGLCAVSLRSDKAAPQASTSAPQLDGASPQAQTVPDRPGKAPEPPQNAFERLDGMSSDLEQVRQRQQWQDSALKEMEISLAKLHQTVLGLEQAIDTLRVEIERVRLGVTAPPAPATPVPLLPCRLPRHSRPVRRLADEPVPSPRARICPEGCDRKWTEPVRRLRARLENAVSVQGADQAGRAPPRARRVHTKDDARRDNLPGNDVQSLFR